MNCSFWCVYYYKLDCTIKEKHLIDNRHHLNLIVVRGFTFRKIRWTVKAFWKRPKEQLIRRTSNFAQENRLWRWNFLLRAIYVVRRLELILFKSKVISWSGPEVGIYVHLRRPYTGIRTVTQLEQGSLYDWTKLLKLREYKLILLILFELLLGFYSWR
jgi:hypothetical protein